MLFLTHREPHKAGFMPKLFLPPIFHSNLNESIVEKIIKLCNKPTEHFHLIFKTWGPSWRWPECNILCSSPNNSFGNYIEYPHPSNTVVLSWIREFVKVLYRYNDQESTRPSIVLFFVLLGCGGPTVSVDCLSIVLLGCGGPTVSVDCLEILKILDFWAVW